MSNRTSRALAHMQARTNTLRTRLAEVDAAFPGINRHLATTAVCSDQLWRDGTWRQFLTDRGDKVQPCQLSCCVER